jgi:hypothetical protein
MKTDFTWTLSDAFGRFYFGESFRCFLNKNHNLTSNWTLGRFSIYARVRNGFPFFLTRAYI